MRLFRRQLTIRRGRQWPGGDRVGGISEEVSVGKMGWFVREDSNSECAFLKEFYAKPIADEPRLLKLSLSTTWHEKWSSGCGVNIDAATHSIISFFPSTANFTFHRYIMRFSTSSVLLAASSLLGAAVAHNIQLAAHGRECFHEQLHRDDKMTVTFQVGDREFGGAGNLDIDFWVCNICRPLFERF